DVPPPRVPVGPGRRVPGRVPARERARCPRAPGHGAPRAAAEDAGDTRRGVVRARPGAAATGAGHRAAPVALVADGRPAGRAPLHRRAGRRCGPGRGRGLRDGVADGDVRARPAGTEGPETLPGPGLRAVARERGGDPRDLALAA